MISFQFVLKSFFMQNFGNMLYICVSCNNFVGMKKRSTKYTTLSQFQKCVPVTNASLPPHLILQIFPHASLLDLH